MIAGQSLFPLRREIVRDLQFLQTDIDDFALSKQKEAMLSHNF